MKKKKKKTKSQFYSLLHVALHEAARDFVPETQVHLLDTICAHYNKKNKKTVHLLCPYHTPLGMWI